jgi:hypothetical protein
MKDGLTLPQTRGVKSRLNSNCRWPIERPGYFSGRYSTRLIQSSSLEA